VNVFVCGVCVCVSVCVVVCVCVCVCVCVNGCSPPSTASKLQGKRFCSNFTVHKDKSSCPCL